MRPRELSITEETTSYLSSQNSPTQQHVPDVDPATWSSLVDTSKNFNISDNTFDVRAVGLWVVLTIVSLMLVAGNF